MGTKLQSLPDSSESNSAIKWLRWLPLAIVIALVLGAWIRGDSTRYEPPYLLVTCNALFLSLACALVAVMAAKTALAGGPTGLLGTGGGALIIAAASIASAIILGQGEVNSGVTIYITGMLVAASAHLLGAAWLTRPAEPTKAGWRAVAACYLGVVLVVLLLIYGSDHLPPFVIDGRATVLRKTVAGLAVAQFLIASGIMLAVARLSFSRFLGWYATGLMLIALGLVVVTLARNVGSALTWVGRISQWIGGIYLLVATAIAMRESRGLTIPLRLLRETQEALRQSEQRYHSLFDAMTEGFAIHELIVDDKGVPCDFRFLEANAAFERLTGLKRDQIIGRLHNEMIPDDDPKWVQIYGEVVLSGKPVQFDNYSPGLRRHYEVSAYRTSPMHFAVIFMDITQRKEIEADLRRASAAKDQFIATLSHELRTPLTPVVASVSALAKDANIPTHVREELAVIERNIALEVHLINDLLDVTRIVSGKLEIHAEATDLASIIRDVGRIVAADLEAKEQTLIIDTPGAPYWVLADRARMHQVFWNLIRNAIKFSPPLSRLRVEGAQADGEVRIKVIDSGPGIAEDELPRLFKAFEQGSAGSKRGGLGLGLKICKGIIDLHYGAIVPESSPRGSVFTVSLPVAVGPQGRPEIPRDETGVRPSPLRILLVEDHQDSARIMTRLLRADGHSVVWAASVSQGLAAAMAGEFDLMVSDLGLPDGTGHDLMRSIRGSGKSITAIVISGYGGHDDISRSHAAGFCAHLTKPVDIQTLRNAISRVQERLHIGDVARPR